MSVPKPRTHSTSTYAWESADLNPDGVVYKDKPTKSSTAKAARNCSLIYATSIAANPASKESKERVVIMKTLTRDLQKVLIEPNQQMKSSLSMRETLLNQPSSRFHQPLGQENRKPQMKKIQTWTLIVT